MGVSVCFGCSGQPFFVATNELHNDSTGKPAICGGCAEEVLGALEERSHVIPGGKV